MKYRLWHNLRGVKKSLEPRVGFKRELSIKLSERFDEIYGRPGIWYQYIWVRTTKVFVTSVVGVSVVTTSVYAYNSPAVTEGSMLYPLKISMEKIEETTKVTPEAKASFLLKKAERREAEREVLVQKFHVKDTEVVSETSSSTPDSTSTLFLGINDQQTTTVSTTVQVSDEVQDSDADGTTEIHATDKDIQEVEHKLAEVKSKLRNTDQGNMLRKKIEARLDKHHDDEGNDESSAPTSSAPTVIAVPATPTTSVDLNVGNNQIKLRIRRDQQKNNFDAWRETRRKQNDQNKENNAVEGVKIFSSSTPSSTVVERNEVKKDDHEDGFRTSTTATTTPIVFPTTTAATTTVTSSTTVTTTTSASTSTGSTTEGSHSGSSGSTSTSGSGEKTETKDAPRVEVHDDGTVELHY